MRATDWQGCQMRSMEAALQARRRRIQAGIAADRSRHTSDETALEITGFSMNAMQQPAPNEPSAPYAVAAPVDTATSR